MLYIAVCDDEEAVAAANAAAAEEVLGKCGLPGRVVTYTDSRNLLYDITCGQAKTCAAGCEDYLYYVAY